MKYTDKEKIEVPFDFKTYTFYKDKIVKVDPKLHAFLEERFPLSFTFSPKVTDDTPEVESRKTKSFIPNPDEAMEMGNQFMKIQNPKPEATFSTVDGLPPTGKTDSEGVEFYGEGVQQDSI